MELIFADDSGKDARKGRYLVLASVAFDESRLNALEAQISSLKGRYGIPPECELHWATRTYKHPKRNPTKTARLTREAHHQLRRDFLGFLASADATIIIGVVEHGRRSLATGFCWCLDFIAERTQMRLQDLARSRGSKVFGLLIADEPGGARENAQVREHLARLHRRGTGFIEHFDTLVMNSLVYPSDLVPGIQLADFAAGAFEYFINRQEEEWWPLIAPHIRRKPQTSTRVLGYGLKLWPPVGPLHVGSTTVH